MAETIKDDDEAQLALTEIEGSCSDAGISLEDENWQEVLEDIESIQEKANALHVYIKGKIDG